MSVAYSKIGEPEWLEDEQSFRIRSSIGRQILEIELQWIDDFSIENIPVFNIYLSLHTKKRHIEKNMQKIATTGESNPFETYRIALKSFKRLVKYALYGYDNCDVILYCTWLDNTRKRIYNHFLSKFGFVFVNNFAGESRCLYKRFKLKDREKDYLLFD